MGAGAGAAPLSAQEACSRRPPQLRWEMGSYSGCLEPLCHGLPRCTRWPPALRERLRQHRYESHRGSGAGGQAAVLPASQQPSPGAEPVSPPRGPCRPVPTAAAAPSASPPAAGPRSPRRPGREEEEEQGEARSPPPPAAERARR